MTETVIRASLYLTVVLALGVLLWRWAKKGE